MGNKPKVYNLTLTGLGKGAGQRVGRNFITNFVCYLDKGKVMALSSPAGKDQRAQGQSQVIFYILSFSTKLAIKNLEKGCAPNAEVQLVLATKPKPILLSS
jgi:hypothetical protein